MNNTDRPDSRRALAAAYTPPANHTGGDIPSAVKSKAALWTPQAERELAAFDRLDAAGHLSPQIRMASGYTQGYRQAAQNNPTPKES